MKLTSLIATLSAGFVGVSAAWAEDTVKMGFIGSAADAPYFLAIDRGYFADAGIKLEMEPMGSLARQIAPLSSGAIDVANGAVSAGFYNAAGRDIGMKIVADKGRNTAGSAYTVFLARKDLYDAGDIRGFADFKGRTVATIGVGSGDMSTINEAMKTVGMTFDDIEQTALPLPNHMVAMENKGIEITLTPEPYATMIVEAGLAVKIAAVGDFYPDQQQTVIIYGANFMEKRPEVAERFMQAYLRGVRDYLAVIQDGRLIGEGSDAVIDSIMTHGGAKDAELLRRTSAVMINPDGQVNAAGIQMDWEFLKSRGLLETSIEPGQLIDNSYADKAVAALKAQ